MSDALALAILGQQGNQDSAHLGVGTLTTAPDSNRVARASLNARTVEAIVPSGVTVAVGDSVLMIREGSALYVLGRLGTTPVPPPDPPDPPPPVTPPRPTYETKTVTFRPKYVGSYRGGWRGDTSDAYAGDWTGRGVNFGRAFYGGGPSGLRRVEEVLWAEVSLRRGTGGVFGGQTLPMALITQKTRPAGSGTVKRSTSGPTLAVNTQTTWRMPQSWADDLVSGAAGGLGVGTGGASPYIRTLGPSSWSSGWTLRVRYRYRTD